VASMHTVADSARRGFLLSSLGGVAGWLATTGALLGRPAPARAGDSPAASTPARAKSRERFAVINADDLGLSAEIDRGIFEAHDVGIVTSTSLIVEGPDAVAAIQQTRQRPDLGLGIHVAFDVSRAWPLDAVQRGLDRQLTAFVRLTGGPPTHIDSHHHFHGRFNVARLFLEAGRRYGVPVRGFSEVVYVGGFYGQPEFGSDGHVEDQRGRARVIAAIAGARRVRGVLPPRTPPDKAGRSLQSGARRGASHSDRRTGQDGDRRSRNQAHQLS
jgi:YdjC-like protein